MTEVREPLADVMLTGNAVDALDLAAQRETDEPVATADLLLAILGSDTTGAWESVQLRTRFLTPEDAKQYRDPEPEPSGSWHGVALTATATKALDRAVGIAGDYNLVPVPPGVLAIGLITTANSGAGQALQDGTGVSSDEISALIQDEILEVTLGDLGSDDPAPASRGRLKDVAERMVRTGSATGSRSRVRSAGWGDRADSAFGLLREAIASAHATDDETSNLLDAMMLDRESLEEAAVGTDELADESADDVRARARRRLDGAPPDPAALIVAVAIGASPRVTEVLRRLALTPTEVAGQLAELRARLHGDDQVSVSVMATNLASAFVSLVTSVLVVLAAVESVGSLWKLVFVYLAWTRYPQFGPVGSTLLAVVFGLVVSPVAGLAHFVGVFASLAQARAERQALLARTGVNTSLAELQRITQRLLNARARKHCARQQRWRASMRALREDRADLD